MSLKFREQAQAEACIKLMNGRRYEGRKLTAEPYDASFPLPTSERRNKDEEAERLEMFGKWLEEASTDDSEFRARIDRGRGGHAKAGEDGINQGRCHVCCCYLATCHTTTPVLHRPPPTKGKSRFTDQERSCLWNLLFHCPRHYQCALAILQCE